ncbi:MAG TPA: condensation domain-containing protein, partial [Longimicrobiaceae bacterium]|nr:condensation domain-containing protein [Longimicrobiaceae bacterium]
MVPAAFVALDALPLTPSGKVDRRALPAPEAPAPAASASAAPSGPVEEALAHIWAAVLRRERVGVHDNFFELGGDSILSIQVIVRAAQAGIRITPRQVFLHQTVAELAAAAGSSSAAGGVLAGQGAVTGEAPLTPLQRWFFARDLPTPSHWNMGLLLDAATPLDAGLLARAAGALAAHHDALRTRFERGEDGWRAWTDAPGAGPAVERVDLSAVADAELEAALREHAARVHAGLDLSAGPLVRIALFDAGPGRPQRVLLAVHHLVVDAVSLPLLAEDLETAYRRLAAGEVVQLPPKTTSFRDWARRLDGHARSPELRAEAEWWLAALPAAVEPLPADHPDAADPEAGTAAHVVELDEEETRALLEEVPAAYGTQVNDALLSALAGAYAAWTGRGSLLVEVEGHGREPLFDDLDVSRTVGWFTTQYPVLLRADGGPGERLKRVKETLRAVPRRGFGYGLLRWLGDPAVSEALAARPHAEVGFNYLGRMDGDAASGGLLSSSGLAVGGMRPPETPRPHRLEVEGVVRGGRLRIAVFYGSAGFRAETVRPLAEAYAGCLRALVAHCREAGAGGFTPSDFPLAGVGQAALDALVPRLLAAAGAGEGARARREIEDLYPLTPLQQGMLFHALDRPGSGAYAEQVVMELEGEVRPEAFAAAWQAVADRHPALRSAA